jgi:hypothetical protein
MSLEDQVRAELDIARGLSDAALKIQAGKMDEVTLAEAVEALAAITQVLMGLTVDLAKAIDMLAGHVGFPPPPPDD